LKADVLAKIKDPAVPDEVSMELLPLISSYDSILVPAEEGRDAMLEIEYEAGLRQTNFQELLRSWKKIRVNLVNNLGVQIDLIDVSTGNQDASWRTNLSEGQPITTNVALLICVGTGG
jgi:hypothetical protein